MLYILGPHDQYFHFYMLKLVGQFVTSLTISDFQAVGKGIARTQTPTNKARLDGIRKIAEGARYGQGNSKSRILG